MRRIIRSSLILIFTLIPASIIVSLLLTSVANVNCGSFQAGYDILDPWSVKWDYYRNLAYVFYVFLFILIGGWKVVKGILVEVSPSKKTGLSKINLSITNIIPTIVFSLLLTTFSYAIAGLCLDMWRIIKCSF